MILRHILFMVMLLGFWLIAKVEGNAQETIQVTDDLSLKDNLVNATPGDYVVTSRGQNYTVWHVYGSDNKFLKIEEITVPQTNIKLEGFSWRTWVENGAQGNSSWIVYNIDIRSGDIQDIYSYTTRNWMTLSEGDNLLSVLLNLPFKKVSFDDRKRVGGRRSIIWNPPMYMNGRFIQEVQFDAWKAVWPKDGSDLSGKTVEVYLPQDNKTYPAYLPYWLEISGMVGKAKVRIVDSGRELISLRKPPVPDAS